MIASHDYQLVEIAEEYLLIPVGKKAEICRDVFTLTKASAYLYGLLNKNKTKEDLVLSLIDRYDVDKETATSDVDQFVNMLYENGLLENE